jgi:hypothetical protein
MRGAAGGDVGDENAWSRKRSRFARLGALESWEVSGVRENGSMSRLGLERRGRSCCRYLDSAPSL